MYLYNIVKKKRICYLRLSAIALAMKLSLLSASKLSFFFESFLKKEEKQQFNIDKIRLKQKKVFVSGNLTDPGK